MAIKKVQGMALAIAAAFGTSITMTAIGNTGTATGTATSNPALSVNDIIEVTSGWKLLDKRVVRVVSTSGTGPYLFGLEGINTTSTSDYPAGEGTGSIRKISSWTSITQLKRDIQTGGGGFETGDATTLDDRRTQTVPLIAIGTQLTFNPFWDPSLAWFNTVKDASNSGALTPFRITLPTGEKLYGNTYWGFNPEPVPVDGLQTAQIQLNNSPETTVYTS